MSVIRYTVKSRIGYFLNEYYFGSTLYSRVVRIIGGPLLIKLGLAIYQSGDEKMDFIVGSIATIYGTYYLLKPFLWVASRWSLFKSELEFRFDLEEQHMIIESEKGKSELRYDALHAVHFRKNYIAIEFIQNQKIYLPVHQLSSEEIEKLKHLK